MNNSRNIKHRIGVIGLGFVGSAIVRAFSESDEVTVFAYDKYKDSPNTLKQVVSMSDIVFVCVPTPMNKDGTCHVDIVNSVLSAIADIASTTLSHPIIVIKSTILPGTIARLRSTYPVFDIVFNPEFLSAATAYEDFLNQETIILGGDAYSCEQVTCVYKSIFPDVRYECTSAIVAEFVKYIKNCFFATKLSFANEMAQMCNCLNINYDDVIAIAKHDDRFGDSHWQVPGPTPDVHGICRRGFSNVCLPKDLSAFIEFAIKLGVDPHVMKGAWNKNIELRPDRDWECLPGVLVKPNE